jgi:tetratricopeptide (TPR) repeat protein
MRFALLIAVSLVAAAVRAESPTDAQIAEAIKQLGDRNFAARERAMKLLWNAGGSAEKQLREAANSSDPEIVRRARVLLDRIAYRIDPDTPNEVVRLMERFRAAAGVPSEQSLIVREMLRLGGKCDKYLLRLLANVEDKQRRLILDEFAYDDWKILSSLTAAGQDMLVEQMLEQAIGAQNDAIVPHYAAFHAHSGKLDEKIALFRTRAQNGLVFDARVLLGLYRIKGDRDGAIDAAKRSENGYWIRQSLMQQGRWSDLLAQHSLRPGSGMNAVADLGLLAAYQRLSGQTADFPASLKKIQEFVGDKGPRRDNRAWYAARVLLVNEQPQLAMDMLAKFEASNLAAEILLSQAKYREALALTEKAAQAETGQQYLARGQHIDLLYGLGETAKAREWLDTLSKDMGATTDPTWLDRMIRWEVRLGRRASAEKRLLDRLDNRDGSSLGASLGTVFPSLGDKAETILAMLAQEHAGDKPSDLFRRLSQIEDQSCPLTQLETLLRANVPVNRNSDTANFEAVAQVVVQFGLADLAQNLMVAANWEKATPSAKLHLADTLANAGRWADAAKAYRTVWELETGAALPLFLHAQARLRINPADADARTLIDRAHRMLLGGDSARFNFYESLVERGFPDDAFREIEFLCRLLANNTSIFGTAQDRLARALAERGDYLTAAAIHERNILRAMPTSAILAAKGFGRITSTIHIDRARGLLQQGKKAEAFKEIEQAEKLHPANLDLGIVLVRALERAGEKQKAQELFERVHSRWEQASSDFPSGADAHNQIAWLCARCRKRLDLALEHAQQATKLAPDVASYFDTLAEVSFQRGDREKAIKFIKKCLTMPQANVGFYRLQLKRFEKGDPKVEPTGE